MAKSVQTLYHGIEFRSKLEARWARFWDSVGWRWQYEPERFGEYLPDFLLMTHKVDMLVEIKPEKSMARLERHRLGIENSTWDGWAMLCGDGPIKWKDFHSMHAIGLTKYLGDVIGETQRWDPCFAYRCKRCRYVDLVESSLFQNSTMAAGCVHVWSEVEFLDAEKKWKVKKDDG